MDLVTVKEIKRPRREADASEWRYGDAWLAGGTWLFSEPQAHLRRLIDLHDLGWEPLVVSDAGLEIAATCTVAQLEEFSAPRDWTAASLFRQCGQSLLASFKIRKIATVGGNVCMSLPAGALTSLTSSLEGVCTIRLHGGGEKKVPVTEFVTGNNKNILQPGDLLRSITLPTSALRKRPAFRRVALTHYGRSTALVIGTRCPTTEEFVLTVTAATEHPVQLRFASLPDARELRDRINGAIPAYFSDVHGTPEYRKHMTHYFAEQIRQELGGKPS